MNFNKLPNFFIIGAAKCGTTTLFDVLRQHPQVIFASRKEPNFFSDDDQYLKGIEWYSETYFKDAEVYPFRGDASTQYLLNSEMAASRIKKVYGNREIKFIAIFRDPVQRAYSGYWQWVRSGKEHLPFAVALLAEILKQSSLSSGLDRYYLRAGRYATNLRPFLCRFPREYFMYLLLDDLKSDFSGTIMLLSDFLDLHSGFAFKQIISNPASLPRSRRLQHLLRQPSGLPKRVLKPIINKIPHSWRMNIKKHILKANLRRYEYPSIDPDIAQELRNYFLDEFKQLEAIIGRDLSHWYSS